MSEKAIKFMNNVTFDAMEEYDQLYPAERDGVRNQQVLNDIIQGMLARYPLKFLKRIGVVEA